VGECEEVCTSLLKGNELNEASDSSGIDCSERPVCLANNFHVWLMLLKEIGSTRKITTGSIWCGVPPSIEVLRTKGGDDGTRKGFV
jgi:hypothetical protein